MPEQPPGPPHLKSFCIETGGGRPSCFAAQHEAVSPYALSLHMPHPRILPASMSSPGKFAGQWQGEDAGLPIQTLIFRVGEHGGSFLLQMRIYAHRLFIVLY